jgi:hypothetical protein
MPDSDLFGWRAESLREPHDVNMIRRTRRRALATASKLYDAPYQVTNKSIAVATALWAVLVSLTNYAHGPATGPHTGRICPAANRWLQDL